VLVLIDGSDSTVSSQALASVNGLVSGMNLEEIRKAVPSYNVPQAGLLTGGAEATRVEFAKNGHMPNDLPVGVVWSAKDTLFTSGTLGRFCQMMESLPEAEAKP
jgi:hypothetical protein